MMVFGVFDADGRIFAIYLERHGAVRHCAFMNDHDDYWLTEFFVQPITLNRPNECPIWDFSDEDS